MAEQAPWETQENELAPWETPEEVPFYTLRPEMLGAGFMAGLGKIDEYTGAPLRKFFTEMATGKELEKAPTGAEQAAMMGAPTTSYQEAYGVPKMLGGGLSPADIYGVGLEIAQDPLMLGGYAAKGISKGAEFLKGLGGLGEAAESTAKAGAKAGASATSAMRGAQEAEQAAAAMGQAAQEATVGGGEQAAKMTGEFFKVKPPQSVKEIEGWQAPAGLDKMQQLERMREIQTTVPDLMVPPTEFHFKMFEDPKAMKSLKSDFDNLSSPVKTQLGKYNISMLNESAQKTEQTIKGLTPGKEILKTADTGENFIQNALNTYKAHKQEAGPLFEQMQKSKPLTAADVDFLKGGIIENTKAAPLLAVDDEGKMFLKPNTSRTGLSDSEYNAIKRVFDDLGGPVTFQDLQRQREYLRKMIDPANPAATEELSKVRSIMLDQLQEMASKKMPNMRQVFQDYAKNETAIDNIEKIIGGKLESMNQIFAANPEKVVKKILSNPNNQEIVSQFLGKDAYNEILASYLEEGFKKSFDEVRGFKPQDMRAFLNQNQNLLARSMAPEQIERLKALADHGYLARRFLDEVNPSGTTEAFLKAIEPGAFTQEVIQKGPIAAVKQGLMSKVLTSQKQKQSMEALNQVLAGAEATTEASAKAKLYEALKAKMPTVTPETAAEVGRAGAATGAVLRMQPKKKEEEKPKAKPNQTNIMQKLQGSPYQSILQNALDQGGEQSFAAANYVLMNRDEKFRKLINEEEV